MSPKSVEKIEPFLSSSADWGLWFMVVKKNAEGGQVWKYVDPSKGKDEIEKLEEPIKPTPAEFGGTTSANIPADRQGLWDTAQRVYQQDVKDYRRASDNVLNINRWIFNHVARP